MEELRGVYAIIVVLNLKLGCAFAVNVDFL